MDRSSILIVALILLAQAGCQSTTESAPPKAAPKAAPGAAAVERIVFVDKKKACACTRERIDASWKALTEVYGFPPTIDVERIHMDQDAVKAAPYKAKRPIMVLPAIYFLGMEDKLLEVLQGEVKAEQIRGLSGAKSPSP